jgi:hypothetical protein
MPKRKDIIRTIITAINGLEIIIDGDVHKLAVYDTLFDPTRESHLPCVYVVSAPESIGIDLSGTQMDRILELDIDGYTNCHGEEFADAGDTSSVFDSVENTIEAIIQKLTSPTWIENIACAFSITKIGPVVAEHSGPEHPYGMIRIHLTVEYLDEGI